MRFRPVTNVILLVLSGALLALATGCGLPSPASESPGDLGQVNLGEAAANLPAIPVSYPEPLKNLSVPPDTTGTDAEPSPGSRFREAVSLYGSGEYRDAGDAALALASDARGTVWEGRALFLAGRAYAAQDDPEAAATLFGSARDRYPVLADYAAYMSAGSYAKAGRLADAAAAYDGIASEYPESPLAPGAALEAARQYVELGGYKEALDRLQAFIKVKRSSAQTSDALLLLMRSFAGLGDCESALAQYAVLWREYPGSDATLEAGRLADGLAEAGRPAPEPTLDDRFRRADRFFSRGSHRSAVRAYSDLLGQLREKSSLRGEALLRLGRSYYSLRDNEDAMKAFREVVDGGYDAQAPEAYYWMSRLHLRGDASGLKDTVMSCSARFPGDSRTVDCLYLLGVNSLSDGDCGTARESLTKILDDFPNTDRKDEVLWWLGLTDYRLGDFPSAEAAFGRLAAEHPRSTLAPQAMYWQAKSAAMQGRPDDAYALYSSAASGYPNSFYGLLAADGGRVDGGGGMLTAGSPVSVAVGDPAPDMPDAGAGGPFERVWELRLQAMNDEAARELKAREAAYSNSLEGVRTVAAVYRAIGVYQRPLELAGGLYGDRLNVGDGTVPDDALDMLFPLAYPEIVLTQAEAFGIDPALVYAVMREESRFNPSAVSPAGAVGLMQLMPGTAKAVCERLNVGFGSAEQLKDEGFNVPLGTCYLASLVERHGGRLAHALAEYNAGPGPLRRWIDRDPAAPDEEFIEGISYYETRSYVKRVLRNYMMYRRMYGGKAVVIEGSGR